jgi:hypothetical protein
MSRLIASNSATKPNKVNTCVIRHSQGCHRSVCTSELVSPRAMRGHELIGWRRAGWKANRPAPGHGTQPATNGRGEAARSSLGPTGGKEQPQHQEIQKGRRRLVSPSHARAPSASAVISLEDNETHFDARWYQVTSPVKMLRHCAPSKSRTALNVRST